MFNTFSNATTLHVRCIPLFCTNFFAVVPRLRRESNLFHFFGGRERLSFCFPEFRYNTVFKNSPPEKITNI